MSADMLIRFEEVPAASQPIEGKDIEVQSWSHGFAQPASPTRSTAGRGTIEQASHQNLTITKSMDDSSTAILRACWSGQQFGKAILRCYRGDGAGGRHEYLSVTMQHVIISNYSISGGPGDAPLENIALDYGTIQYSYNDQKQGKTAAAPATHDLVNQKVT